MAAHKNSCLFPEVNISRLLALLLCLFALGLPLAAQITPGAPVAPPEPEPQVTPAPNPQQNQPPSDMPTIAQIRFEGNRRIRTETLQARIFSRVGDPYNQDALRRDFQALWNTQYFEDIRLEVQDSPDKPNGKIVTFYVVERPIIRRIEYHGIKSITESDILDRFKDRKVGLSVEGQFDPTKIKKAEVAIKDLEAEHGHQFAVVKPTYEKIPATNAVKLVFTVDEGPKVKVGMITFQGNHAFSSRRIIRSMKLSRPISIPLWFFDVPIMHKTFDRQKLNEDLEAGIRDLYQSAGYFKVVVKDPILNTVDVNRPGLGPFPIIGHEHGKATNITIPIEEGEQYRMGKLVIRSADPEKGLSLKREYLEAIFPLHQGDIFDISKIRKAIENYNKLYGVYGYIDFTAVPLPDVHDDTKIIDLTLDFDEQKQYFVRRIDFSGNTTTRDKVIRRELMLSEGDIFNNHAWELSLLRLNQLDYFEKIKPENAEIKRNTKNSTVDILLKLKEKGKQSISLTGGVSGIAGSFIGLSYQTNNFLGLGETLTLSGQVGDIQKSALFGFTEPYLLDRPIATGFTVSYSSFNFNQSRQESILFGQQIQINPNVEQDYTQNTVGGTFFASYPLRKFSFARLGMTYGYSHTDITAYSTASTDLFEVLQFQSLGGPSALTGIDSSYIMPSFTYNTVNNPMNPSTGKSLFYSVKLEGVGGNVKAVTNVLEAKYFRPTYHKRNVLAFHFVGSFVSGYGGLVTPPFERLFLGGEQDLRGFDIRTVTPIAFIPIATTTSFSYVDPTHLDIAGNATVRTTPAIPVLTFEPSFPGGDTSGVFNGEYRIPIVGPVQASAFLDAGVVGALRTNQLQINSQGLGTIQALFPNFNSKALLLQPGTNFAPRASTGIEFVVQLPIINAPFRLYWAYNFARVEQQIAAPIANFQSNQLQAIENSVGSGLWNSQILPQLQNYQVNSQRINFFEPASTFRFTVSRTF
ncbi:MAG TPA: outer membrane protein assembly factor BamA [Candidatus Acidoferrales bacterium]|nr:outer membrane protein assembly factor BamA [Candidatus Acidoferrales bacterium]